MDIYIDSRVFMKRDEEKNTYATTTSRCYVTTHGARSKRHGTTGVSSFLHPILKGTPLSHSINSPTSPPVRAIHPPYPSRLLPRPPSDCPLELQQRAGHLVTDGCLAALMMDRYGPCSDNDGWLRMVAAVRAAGCSLAGSGDNVGARFAMGQAGDEGGFFGVG